MIICSCTVITDAHIETALIEILNQPNAPLPTPGVVFRHLSKKMNCCGCAPLVVTKIYELVDKLEREGRVCPYASASTKVRLEKLNIALLRKPAVVGSAYFCSPEPVSELTSA